MASARACGQKGFLTFSRLAENFFSEGTLLQHLYMKSEDGRIIPDWSSPGFTGPALPLIKPRAAVLSAVWVGIVV